MIVYQADKQTFLDDAFKNDIQEVVLEAYQTRTGRMVGKSELQSWKESLLCMVKVLNDEEIPGDSGVAIEYNIPQTGKRIDFILTGRSENNTPNVIIVELKQWSEAKPTDKDGVVRTRFHGGEQEVSHPSYQAWSYAALLEGFNEAVYEGKLVLKPCAYLHNYSDDGAISDPFYQSHIDKAPLFLKGEAERQRLRSFIKKYVRYGDDADLIYKIENGRIRPSKMLVDSLVKMIQGKQEFVLIDDQKVVFENAVFLAKKATSSKKEILIVEGGPGTGKSVVAINLLVALSKLKQVCRYVSKNAAPRAVFESKLTGSFRRNAISNLFSGSGAFTSTEKDSFDSLIVDEAHRLNEKSGLYGNLGENQIKEIIAAAKCSIFFLDEDQRVTLRDIGSKEQIAKWAKEFGANVSTLTLSSQFRCNGSDGYLAWLDNTLMIRPTPNDILDNESYDFRVVDTPIALQQLVTERNVNNKARVVAGYCWKWESKKKPQAYDVLIPEYDFKKRWNLSSDGSLWIVAPNSVEEIGCIHTSQGLEVDYIGVIIGPDFVVRNGVVQTLPEKRATSDKSLSGYKKMYKANPVEAKEIADLIIKNTYRTLMTRGMKGCFIYCTDLETADYFRSRVSVTGKIPVALTKLEQQPTVQQVDQPPMGVVFPFVRIPGNQVVPFKNAVPLVDLKFAAGAFSESQEFDPASGDWVELPEGFEHRPELFVAQVIGESMNKRISSGSWCLFRLNPKGTRDGKVVVAQHRSISDPELGGTYTVKVYKSEKVALNDGTWRHSKVELRPDSSDPEFSAITFGPDAMGTVKIIAELVAVLH